MHSVIFTQAARAELIDAQDWYDLQVGGLGSRFLAEADAAIQYMSANPKQFPVVYKKIRRALVRRFPYALMYVIDPDETLLVIACFHASRDPKQWRKRI